MDSMTTVVGGVDTHLDLHVAAALDERGGLLGTASFPTTPAGYARLLDWLRDFGQVRVVGVEGTGSYGAGLSRFLQRAGIEVLEVDRPNRQQRRKTGKSDTVDAVAAARAVLAGTASGKAKTRDGRVESIRVLRVARVSAHKARTQAINQLKSLVCTAPADLREQLRGRPSEQLITVCAALRPGNSSQDVTAVTKRTLRLLARRAQSLQTEIDDLDELIAPLVAAEAPELLARHGVGPDTAGALLVAAGDNPDRLHGEASFARLCGVAPIPASSGKVSRHRLHRGGDRTANAALWRIVITRMASDPRTREYVARRDKEGLSKREIIRCLKRYVARELFAYLPREIFA
jgi:transposase